MKRFIDLGDQTGNIDVKEGGFEFAFYCTVRDEFETFSGSQTWSSIEEFMIDYEGIELERYIGLIPNKYKFAINKK